jgi:crotonobetainyl-CoA:carnitine CoA-transferase CaiB-like acyl-CoA transferase
MSFLSSYRVLDLTDERGLAAGRMFADLGAEVVHVEPLAGSSARQHGPFVDGGETGSRSLLWEAYTCRQRSVTCNIETPAGRELLLRLAAKADFLFESASAGRMASLGLSYEDFQRVNPALVHVSITAFGDDGPKAGYVDPDLIVWAAGGPLQPHRDGERPPIRITVPQAFRNAGADAAGGAMLAHLSRVQTGQGQHVSVSAQISVAQTTVSKILAGAIGDRLHGSWQHGASEPLVETKIRVDQSGSGSSSGAARSKWRVSDGFVETHLAMGPPGGRTNNMWQWLRDNEADGDLPVLDWREVPELIISGQITLDDLEPYRERVREFLLTKTKAEVAQAAVDHTFMAAAIATIADIVASPQHQAHKFWLTMGEGTDREVTVAGPWAQTSEPAFSADRSPAPLIGEHNVDVYSSWLDLDHDAVDKLQAEGTI